MFFTQSLSPNSSLAVATTRAKLVLDNSALHTTEEVAA